MESLSHGLKQEAVGSTLTVTLSPLSEGTEVLRVSGFAAPIEDLGLDASGLFAAWIAETEETAYLSMKDFSTLIEQVQTLLDGFERVTGVLDRRSGGSG